MTSTKVWGFGDRVVHTGKPEWGAGIVNAAVKSQQDGRPCQMLTVRFDRAGVKTISTAFANLIAAEDAPRLPDEAVADVAVEVRGLGDVVAAPAGLGAEFGARADAAAVRASMLKLPEAATDPFSTPMARLGATLALYRFTPAGASLLDWAAIQSGMADPMSRFNRHELEKFFEGFVVVRDQQLRKAVLDARKADPGGTSKALSQAPASAQQALRRIDAGR